jgi:hypothetical protein
MRLIENSLAGEYTLAPFFPPFPLGALVPPFFFAIFAERVVAEASSEDRFVPDHGSI